MPNQHRCSRHRLHVASGAVAVAGPCGLLHPVQRHVQQQGADHPPLGSPLQRRGELPLVHHPGLQPCPDRSPCREGPEAGQKLVVIDVVERPGQIGVEDPPTFRALAAQCHEDVLDRIVAAAPRPESVGSRLEARLPLGLQRILHACLLHAVRDDRNSERAKLAVCLRDVHPPDRQGLPGRGLALQPIGQVHPLPGGECNLPVDACGPAASVSLRHLPHAHERVGPAPQHQLLQLADPPEVPSLRRLEDSLP
jgi:hypothetical protein